MPFDLRNARATYQRVVNILFKDHEIYKVICGRYAGRSKQASTHVVDLTECFAVLRKNGMSLNPAKCAFGVKGGKFLSFVVTQRGIKSNLKKIQALINMKSLATIKDVQSLAGRVVTLNRFISKVTDKFILFFKTLKKA